MGVDTSHGHPAMDYRAHTATYSSFTRGVSVTVVLAVIVLALMATFLV